MRILALSDSHGDAMAVKFAIDSHPEAEAVIFLGDGIKDLVYASALLENKRVYTVQGNNDFYSDEPKHQIISEGGINIYITHGHYEYVKSGLSTLLMKTRDNNCTLALYGHTHNQQADYIDGTYLFNPGSLRNDEYGIIDIEKNGIICINQKLKGRR